MSDPASPSARQPSGCWILLVALVGCILLLPGVCAIIVIAHDPWAVLIGPIFLMLAIGAVGVAMLWMAVTWRR